MQDVNGLDRWQLREGKRWCSAHDETFALTAVCKRCLEDPGPPTPVSATIAVTHPDGCPAAAELRRALAEDIAALRALRIQLLAKPDAPTRGKKKKRTTVVNPRLANAVAKVQSEITRATRVLMERADRFEDDVYITAMLEEKRRNGGRH